jgi:aminomethyltransferase
MTAPETTLATPLKSRHETLGAKMVPFAGYTMPIQYKGISHEHQAVRTACGLFDVCHMGEIRVTGSSAQDFVNRLVTNDLNKVALGQAMYTCACRESGGIVDDLICYKHANDDILIVCNASNREKFWQHLVDQANGDGRLSLRDESDATGLIALQGPKALAALAAAHPSLAELGLKLRPFRFQPAEIAGCSVTVARTGYTGEDGVEIFCRAEDAPAVWDRLMEVGEPYGITPAGLGARDTLRLEARLSLYGNELSETTNPLEAGLAWTVKTDKPDFIGKAALVEIERAGLARRIVGFEVTGRGSARAGYPLLDANGASVGTCTSGGPSPTLGRPIGLGFLPLSMTEIGTEFLVDARGKHLPARVVPTPFYRRS